QGLQLARRTMSHHFHCAVCQIAGIPAQTELPGPSQHEIAEPYPLDPPADQEPPGHAGRLRALRYSTTIGRIESTMIAITTRLKFSRTTGRLPKRYPAHTK